jgi:hypothetical protein
MQVGIRFFGNYRGLIDSPGLTVELDDERATVMDVLNLLTERAGDNLRSALLVERSGEVRLKAGIRIAVGDEMIDSTSDLRAPVVQGSYTSEKPIRIFIFPSLMGGR